MWIPINTNGKVECRNRNPNVSLTRRKIILQHETLQPQRVSTLNVLANSHYRAMMNKGYHYMHIWLVESSMVIVLRKANFSLQQRNKFYLTIMVVVKH